MKGRLVEVLVLASRQTYKAAPNRLELTVEGPSVFVRNANTLRELPRAACALVYDVSEPKAPKAARTKGK